MEPYRVLEKHQRAICTECGHVCRIMVWDRGRDHLCYACIEDYDRRAAYREANGGEVKAKRRHLQAMHSELAARHLSLPQVSQVRQMTLSEVAG